MRRANEPVGGVDWTTTTTADLSNSDRSALKAMLLLAFPGCFDDHHWANCLGGLHVIGVADGEVVGHAAVVQRSCLVDGVEHRVGYIEAVAVTPARQGTGLGEQAMARVNHCVDSEYSFGALASACHGFYVSCGWTLWPGALSMTGAAGEPVASPDMHGTLFVRGIDATPEMTLQCDSRPPHHW